jgi:hypothetical protein
MVLLIEERDLDSPAISSSLLSVCIKDCKK